MSSDDQNVVITDVDDINQCILNIINTQKGSDPMNPIFGVDLMSYIDKPIQQIGPILIKEILSALNTWEPRIIVDKISYVIDGSQVTIEVLWSANNLTGKISNTYATS